jgi:hypothetical protein
MTYKFKSKAAADILMLTPHGDQVLHLIGKQPAPQGIIEFAQLPAAMAALQAAVEADEAQRAPSGATAAHDDDPVHDERGREDHVSLRQRVQPLRAMMAAALAEKQDIVWGV